MTKSRRKIKCKHLIDEIIKLFIVLVDQEDNPNQSRRFEGEDDLNVGKELRDVCQMQYIFQSS
jgi:hypothetical protein